MRAPISGVNVGLGSVLTCRFFIGCYDAMASTTSSLSASSLRQVFVCEKPSTVRKNTSQRILGHVSVLYFSEKFLSVILDGGFGLFLWAL